MKKNWLIGGLAIIIGGVGMMNAQLMSVSERTREIGVLRAVGWSSRRVLVMILSEIAARSLFNISISFAWEYSAYAMGVAMFGGAAFTLRTGGHIRVSLLGSRLPPAASQELARHLLVARHFASGHQGAARAGIPGAGAPRVCLLPSLAAEC